MQTIKELLARDLSRPIEEVIKVDQQDEQTVYDEIREYVATDRIKRQYLELLDAMAAAPGEPTEGIGVWISGFFGSGKSSFAKNLGYILANRSVLGKPASDLFLHHLQQQAPGDQQIADIRDRLVYINSRYDSHVIMFDVQVDRAVKRSTELIAEIMYTVLLRELDYALDYDVAELEMELESEGRLATFIATCADLFGEQIKIPAAVDVVPVTLSGVSAESYAIWKRVSKGAQRIQRASAVLHAIDPATYPTQDSWAASLQTKSSDISIRTLVERTFELSARRRPGHAIVFIIDEVGQYVARSAEKIENLRAVVEQFGIHGKNRVLAGKAVAPVWVIVTSQEKLDEVVAAIDDKRVELAKMQDRFKLRIDMAPADIREVATKRVLAKHPSATTTLGNLYSAHQAQFHTHTQFERTTRQSDVDRDAFVQFYPYLPYFIDLSIDIVSGIRNQPGAPRHIGGSNRTIIKQTYEMLVSDRTNLASAAVGTLVTLDRIFDLVEGNLSSEKQKDITDIMQRWPHDLWPARVAKAIALLEYVRDLPRTPQNLAALLYPEMGAASPLAAVEDAIRLLHAAQFIRETENGWKLQTAQEKSWLAERNAHAPTDKQRNDLLEDVLRSIVTAANLGRYTYQKRTFRVEIKWNNRTLTSGDAQIPLTLHIADGPDLFEAECNAVRDDSRSDAQRNTVAWVLMLNDEIDEIVAELHRSQAMVGKYDQLRALQKITREEAASLSNEKSEVTKLQIRLKDRLERQLAQGRGFFRGVSKEASNLGKSLAEIWRGLFSWVVPDLYPKLELGAKSLKADDPIAILKAANLNGLPKVYYDPPDGLDLIKKEGAKFVVNQSAPVLKEVSDFLAREHSYGNKVTGRSLENHLSGLGYGWEREVIWLTVATLLRAGAIEVTYQGRRYRNHLDPQIRLPFEGTNAFRAASFAPRQVISLQTLVQAVQRYEALTGDEVDVEETAIAQAFQTLARQELEALLPVEATVKAHEINGVDFLTDYRQSLETILNSTSDDVVGILAGEGASFQQLRDQVATLRKATAPQGLARLRRIRSALTRIWPQISADTFTTDPAQQADLQAAHNVLADANILSPAAATQAALQTIEAAYAGGYARQHEQRRAVYQAAVDTIEGLPEWSAVRDDMHSSLLAPLSQRADHAADLEVAKGQLNCTVCQATLAQMAADLAAVDQRRNEIVAQIQRLAAPEEKIERVRLTDIVGVGFILATEEDVKAVAEQISDYLSKVVATGSKIILE